MNIYELIEENPNINITVSGKDLMVFAKHIADLAAQKALDNYEEKLYTREEVMKTLSICAATLWRWDRLDLIQGKKIGNRK